MFIIRTGLLIKPDIRKFEQDEPEDYVLTILWIEWCEHNHHSKKNRKTKKAFSPGRHNRTRWMVLTISRGRNMSSCRSTTRHTLSPCRVLRSIHTSSSWLTPVTSMPLTYTSHDHFFLITMTLRPSYLIFHCFCMFLVCLSSSVPPGCGLLTAGVHL